MKVQGAPAHVVLFLILVISLPLSIIWCAASTTTTWALDVGTEWGGFGSGYLITPDSFEVEVAAYPDLSDAGLLTLQDAAYDHVNSTFYMSGGDPESAWYTQNSIAVYQGGTDGLTFISVSKEGMGSDPWKSYHWLGGIEHVDGSIYAIAYVDTSDPHYLLSDAVKDVLLRIVKPGTPNQLAVQVGDYLGDYSVMGVPFALCKDDNANFYAAFSGISGEELCLLYNIDRVTGVPALLQTYSRDVLGGMIEGLAFADGHLFALTTEGNYYEIDTATYEAELLGMLPESRWTALVPIDGPELPPPVTYYVDGVYGSDAYDGLAAEWDGTHGPKKTIQAGLDAASSTDTVLVAPGTYRGTGNKELNYDGKSITLRATEGPGRTIIDCERAGRAFMFQWGESEGAVVDGFSIINGLVEDYGAGIYCFHASPTVRNCTVRDCHAGLFGGGIAYRQGGEVLIANCLVEECSAGTKGGGVFIGGDTVGVVRNCTIAENGSLQYGGGLGVNWYTDLLLMDSILWGNDAPLGSQVSLTWPCVLSVEYCDMEGSVSGIYADEDCGVYYEPSNMPRDPLFVAGPLHDYYLSCWHAGQDDWSPCIDAGSDTAANLGLDMLTTRTDGVGDDGIVDMGYHAPYSLWVDRIGCSGDDVTIHWNDLSGVSYSVQWSDDMETWNDVAVGETDNWTHIGGALVDSRYYRVKEAE